MKWMLLTVALTVLAIPASEASSDEWYVNITERIALGFFTNWGKDFMSVDEVCRRWGEDPFDVEAFRFAEDGSVRAEMTCSLLRTQKKYVGMDARKVRDVFGPYSGYYWSEADPTYLIEIAETKEQDSWQIVFFRNRKGKVAEIVVHKNCCNHLEIFKNVDDSL